MHFEKSSDTCHAEADTQEVEAAVLVVLLEVISTVSVALSLEPKSSSSNNVGNVVGTVDIVLEDLLAGFSLDSISSGSGIVRNVVPTTIEVGLKVLAPRSLRFFLELAVATEGTQCPIEAASTNLLTMMLVGVDNILVTVELYRRGQ